MFVRDSFKPYPAPNRGQPLNKGSTTPQPKPSTPFPINPQKNQAPQRPQPNPQRPNLYPINQRRCYKCQGLGHIASDCPSRKVVTLAEWEATEGEFAEEKEEEKEEDVEEDPEETQEEFTENADEGEMLVIRRVMST